VQEQRSGGGRDSWAVAHSVIAEVSADQLRETDTPMMIVGGFKHALHDDQVEAITNALAQIGVSGASTTVTATRFTVDIEPVEWEDPSVVVVGAIGTAAGLSQKAIWVR
jgi:hypothetical protein